MENLIDKLKNFFISFIEFFKKIFFHEKTENVIVAFGKAKEKVVYNLRSNKNNWKHRTFEDHGFRIEEEDT